MKLKRLEVSGFKSFPDRTTFEFEDRLTAVVGPNGAGKSNVVDAIKWVLGERSAQKLRGSEMASLIFNGSADRKALGRAEVKLVIDNADGRLDVDYEEVSIGRRVDRTGQSDYLLNGSKCRLQDIRDLLMDTGVGTTAYSFIEQGQIDRLLQSSPTERRQVFEEAAGINRFLEQTRRTERKLEKVTRNLERVKDILQEVERQLRSVKYQAGRARTFKRQTARLQRLRLADSLHTHRRLQARREELRQKIESAAEARDGIEREARQLEAELEEARAGLEKAQEDLSESRRQLTRTDARIESLQRERELNRRRLGELEHQVDELAGRREGLLEDIEKLERELAEAEEDLNDSAEQLEEKSARHARLSQRARELRDARQEAEQQLETEKEKVFDLYQRESELNNQSEVVAAEKRTLRARIERVQNRCAKLESQLAEVREGRSEIRSELESVCGRIEALRAKRDDQREAINGLDAKIEGIAERQSAKRSELNHKVGRRDVLEDLEERAEGVGSGAKWLLEADLPGGARLVADLLGAALEDAPVVEAALGRMSQAVVVQNSAAGRQALHLLDEERAGRAQVVPMDRVEPQPRAHLDWAGSLADAVEPESGAEELVEMLLGNAFRVEDVESAVRRLEDCPPHGRLVTESGEVFAAGVWSGGHAEAPSLITRRSELTELEEQIAGLEAELAELADRRRALQSRRSERHEALEQLRTELEGLQRDRDQKRSRLEGMDDRAEELREDLELAAGEEKSVRKELEELDRRDSRLSAQLAETRAERQELEDAVEADRGEVESLRQQEEEAAEEAGELSNEVARTRERHRNLKSLVQRLRGDKQRRSAELEALRDRREDNARRREEAEAAMAEAERSAESLHEQRRKLGEAIESRRKAVEEGRRRISNLSDRTREAAERRQQVDERLQKLRVQEKECAVKTEDLLDRAAEDYGVRVEVLPLEPERWREESPFTKREIEEYSESAPEEEAEEEPVAAWYRRMQSAEGEGEDEDDSGPETLPLEEAVALREDVLELADDPETDWREVREEIATLKAKVDRIGNVNVDAIREQDELETRLQFLTDQKEDLEKARRHERQIIRELNKKSRERFRQTFEEVRGNFQGLFRKLFGGGSANLILDTSTEEEGEERDILEAGIQITARPPGKETATLQLLSGGEKAMTTVALLFAMFQAKPSPFCLLDEVDAPLDDANVERFLLLLREFQQDTQFIIITHNKLTMSMAGVLYGLTMTDGVSRKISVRFEDVDRVIEQEAAPRAKAG
ncbi:MAG: chromosome segregation protein SMC [Planctomycetota bacterium]